MILMTRVIQLGALAYCLSSTLANADVKGALERRPARAELGTFHYVGGTTTGIGRRTRVKAKFARSDPPLR
jgi:hypothetical protein